MSTKRRQYPFDHALQVGVNNPVGVTALQYFLQGKGILKPRIDDSPPEQVASPGVFDLNVMRSAVQAYQRRIGLKKPRVRVNGIFGPKFWLKMLVRDCVSFVDCLARAQSEAEAAADAGLPADGEPTNGTEGDGTLEGRPGPSGEDASGFPPTAFPATSGPAPIRGPVDGDGALSDSFGED